MQEMNPIPMPMQEGIRDIYTDLLDRGCAVSKAVEPMVFGPDADSYVIADFILEDGSVGAVMCVDLQLAAKSGAALVMMPNTVAQEAIDANTIDGDMFDCFKEVVNVMTSLMNKNNTPRLKFRSAYRSGEMLPGATRTMMIRPDRRRDFDVTIEEYGTGKMTLMVLGIVE